MPAPLEDFPFFCTAHVPAEIIRTAIEDRSINASQLTLLAIVDAAHKGALGACPEDCKFLARQIGTSGKRLRKLRDDLLRRGLLIRYTIGGYFYLKTSWSDLPCPENGDQSA